MKVAITCVDCQNGMKAQERSDKYLYCRKICAYVRTDKDRCMCWHFEFRREKPWERLIRRIRSWIFSIRR